MADKKYNVTHLKISSWAGVSLGATHFYGQLTNVDGIYQLRYCLTKRGAEKLNIKDHEDAYSAGNATERFETEKQVIKFAIKEYKKIFPKSNVLVKGSASCREPKLVLDCPDCFDMETANLFYNAAYKLGFYDNSANDKAMDILTNAYEQLFK